MRTKHWYMVVVLLTCLTVSSCARLTSIYRSETIPTEGARVVAVDAKQRLLLTNTVGNSKQRIRRFCAEPPPDVFTALATSLGADLSLGAGPDPSTAAKFASSISENASTVERSQTVNVLREVMYRNCERFLSGAITTDEFIVQAARDQRLIIHVLAIEQITGAARAQATALTTVAKATASGVTDVGLESLSGAKKDFESKRTATDKLKLDAAALVPVGVCGAKPIDTAALPTGVTAVQADAKNAKCAELAIGAEREKESQKYFATVQEAVARQTEISSSASGAIVSAALSASQVSEAVARQVVEIVKQNNAFDEIGMTCVIWVRSARKAELPEYCKALLNQMAVTRQTQLAAEETDLDRISDLRVELRTQAQTSARIVWKSLGNGTNVNDAQLARLETKAGVKIPKPRRDELISAGSDFAKFSEAFGTMYRDKQQKLADAAQ